MPRLIWRVTYTVYILGNPPLSGTFTIRAYTAAEAEEEARTQLAYRWQEPKATVQIDRAELVS